MVAIDKANYSRFWNEHSGMLAFFSYNFLCDIEYISQIGINPNSANPLANFLFNVVSGDLTLSMDASETQIEASMSLPDITLSSTLVLQGMQVYVTSKRIMNYVMVN